jgi:hypothetical protein
VVLVVVLEVLVVVLEQADADGGAGPAKPLGFVVVVVSGPEACGTIPEGAAVG